MSFIRLTSVYVLLILILFQDIARFRPELRILISSATLAADKFSEYFDNAPIFYGALSHT